MGKKYKRLFEDIVSETNFDIAYKKTAKDKRRSHSYLEFKEYAALNLKLLREEIADKAYIMGDYRQFKIFDPKERLISALPFRDRIVQHAINNVIEPIFEKTLLPYTFACRPNKGTHAGVVYIQSCLRKPQATHTLKTDFSKYFPSINRARLYQEIEAKIKCRDTLDLIKTIVPDTGTGLHIGSLSSQLWANVYGGIADKFIHHELKPFAWARYMDDIVVVDNDSVKLRDMKDRLEQFSKEEMRMNFSKWSVQSLSRGVNFLGYRIWPGYKLIRKDSVKRAKKKIAMFKKMNDQGGLDRFSAAWKGHVSWADSHNLLKTLEIDYV